MPEALFQHIPRCLFEPVAVLGAIGLIFFLYDHWKKDKAETLLWGFAVFFMIIWRVVMPIRSDRYALILIPIAIYTSLGALEKIVFFCRRFLPSSALLLFTGILLAACVVKSFSRNSEDRYMFRLLEILKKEARDSSQVVHVKANRDVSVFLGDRFEVDLINIREEFRKTGFPPGEYYFLKLKRKQKLPGPGTENLQELYRITPPGGRFDFVLGKTKAGKK